MKIVSLRPGVNASGHLVLSVDVITLRTRLRRIASFMNVANQELV